MRLGGAEGLRGEEGGGEATLRRKGWWERHWVEVFVVRRRLHWGAIRRVKCTVLHVSRRPWRPLLLLPMLQWRKWSTYRRWRPRRI